MKRYILTGTPGAGKTTILYELKRLGYAVIQEAATDVIALQHSRGVLEPWRQPYFIDKIARLQKQRQIEAALSPETLQIYDRSPICTLALCRHLGYAPSVFLLEEIKRI